MKSSLKNFLIIALIAGIAAVWFFRPGAGGHYQGRDYSAVQAERTERRMEEELYARELTDEQLEYLLHELYYTGGEYCSADDVEEQLQELYDFIMQNVPRQYLEDMYSGYFRLPEVYTGGDIATAAVERVVGN